MKRAWAAGTLIVACALWGCNKSPTQMGTPPPTPATATNPQNTDVDDPATDQVDPTPEPAAPEPAPVEQAREPIRPKIPESPVKGDIDGRAFDVVAVRREGSAVVFRDGTGRSVTLVFFDNRIDVEVLGDAQFGDPQVFIRADPNQPPTAYVKGYRLVYNEETGELWLQLPEDRGTVTGKFQIE